MDYRLTRVHPDPKINALLMPAYIARAEAREQYNAALTGDARLYDSPQPDTLRDAFRKWDQACNLARALGWDGILRPHHERNTILQTIAQENSREFVV